MPAQVCVPGVWLRGWRHPSPEDWGGKVMSVINTHLLQESVPQLSLQRRAQFYSVQLDVNIQSCGAQAPAAATPGRAGASPAAAAAECSRHRMAPEQLPRAASMVVSVVSCMAVIPQDSNYWSGPLWAKPCASTQWEQGWFFSPLIAVLVLATHTHMNISHSEGMFSHTNKGSQGILLQICVLCFPDQILCKLGSKSCNERLNLQCSTR